MSMTVSVGSDTPKRYRRRRKGDHAAGNMAKRGDWKRAGDVQAALDNTKILLGEIVAPTPMRQAIAVARATRWLACADRLPRVACRAPVARVARGRSRRSRTVRAVASKAPSSSGDPEPEPSSDPAAWLRAGDRSLAANTTGGAL